MLALAPLAAIVAMQAGSLPPLDFSETFTGHDGTVYAYDKTAIRQITRSGHTVRSVSVRVTYPASVNPVVSQSVRGYYVRCSERTAGVLSSINTARDTGRISMNNTKLEAIVYRPFDELELAERGVMAVVCAASL